MPGQTPTLLVVDEDWVFREFQARTLGDRGYTVMKATGAAEAMLLARTTPIINLLLTDYSMVGLDGLELTNQFRAFHPEAPVLMFTGSLPLPSQRIEKLERFAVLGKPYDLEELLHKVRSLLDAVVPLPRRESSGSN
jgi:DNA-binding response OmpR family regulator